MNDKPYDDRISMSPAIGALEATVRMPVYARDALSEDGEVDQRKLAKDSLTFIQLATGVPVAPLGRPVGYAIGVDQGTIEEPENELDRARGLIAGR